MPPIEIETNTNAFASAINAKKRKENSELFDGEDRSFQEFRGHYT